MKNLVLVSLVALSLASNAQILLTNNLTSTTLAPNAVIDVTTAVGSNTNITINIKNMSSVNKDYKVKRYDMTLNAGATAYFCFAGSCYGPNVINAIDSLRLIPGQSASQVTGQYQMLVADLDEGPAIGYSLVKYTFYDMFNTNDSIQFAFRYNPTYVGIKELNRVNNSKIKIYPNPSTDGIVTLESGLSTANIEVLNSLGKVVLTQTQDNTSANKTQLDMSALPAGVYFVRVTSDKTSYTNKLVLSK